jgi:hypothetical protein
MEFDVPMKIEVFEWAIPFSCAQVHSFAVLINVTSSNTGDTKVSPIPSSHRFASMLMA